MTRNFLYSTIFTGIFLFMAGLAVAQTETVVSAVVDRSQILIGERIELKLTADIPEARTIRFFQLDSLPHFEFIAFGKIDTTNTGTGTMLSQSIQITSFDSGHWVIPALMLGNEAMTDSIPVDVGFSPVDPAQPYHGIKDILSPEVPEQKKSYWLWWLLGGAVLLAALLSVMLNRKKKPVVRALPVVVDPFREAMESLQKLKEGKFTSKAFYTGLTGLFRVYVEKRRGIQSLQQTTEDLVGRLSSVGMEPSVYKELADVLQFSDLVKFARYESNPADDKRAFSAIKAALEHIEDLSSERAGAGPAPGNDMGTKKENGS